MSHPTTRVLTMLELLQAHHRMGGAELARRLGVDERTVRRYAARLDELGVPVVAERGRYGGYRLMPGYKLPPLMLTGDEATAVVLGLLAGRRIGLPGQATESALAKIQRVLAAELRDRLPRMREPRAMVTALSGYLAGELGFRGNELDYYDPRNSYLNEVLDRRLGIPISLAVVVMEVGRRLGLPLVGIGMPGHFLVRHGGVVFDPFNRGAPVDTSDLDEALLEPVGAKAILARMLGNLKHIYASQGDVTGLEWVLRLRTAIPGVPDEERHQLTRLRARWN